MIRTAFLIFSLLLPLSGVRPDSYQTYHNGRFDYSISYPADLLAPQGEADNGDGQRFLSKDGRAELIVYGAHNVTRQSLRALYEEQARDGENRKVTYKLLRKDWFVVSGSTGDRVFYQKTLARGGVRKTFRIEYDKSQAHIFDEVTKRVAGSFRG